MSPTCAPGTQIELETHFLVTSQTAMSLVPMRCFTCGEPLASKYVAYVNEVERIKGEEGCAGQKTTRYLTDPKDLTPSTEAKVLDKFELYKMCCRRIMLTHVDIF